MESGSNPLAPHSRNTALRWESMVVLLGCLRELPTKSGGPVGDEVSLVNGAAGPRSSAGK